jgi:hypothetical protein
MNSKVFLTGSYDTTFKVGDRPALHSTALHTALHWLHTDKIQDSFNINGETTLEIGQDCLE